MGVGGFKDLRVWQEGKDLAVFIYKLTSGGQFSRDFGLTDQMRRSAVSISSNIAEGDQRETDKEAVRYFYFAKGSVAELLTQAIIAYEIGYLKRHDFEHVQQTCNSLAGMLARLIAARSMTFKQKTN